MTAQIDRLAGEAFAKCYYIHGEQSRNAFVGEEVGQGD